MEHEVIPFVIGALGTIPKGIRRLRNQRIRRYPPDYSTIKIGQKTENSSGDLKRLAVIQTPMRNYQLKLVKNSQKSKIICWSNW